MYGNLFGLLAAHPLAPLVIVHHLDVVNPIFPNMTRLRALQHLNKAVKIDSAGIMQQCICYDKEWEWSLSVSWGYAVQIYRSLFLPRELEMPARTFLNWYRRADFTAYAFNTRPVTRHPCQKPFIYFMKDVRNDQTNGQTISNYVKQKVKPPECRWRIPSPEVIESIRVVKNPDTLLWKVSNWQTYLQTYWFVVNQTVKQLTLTEIWSALLSLRSAPPSYLFALLRPFLMIWPLSSLMICELLISFILDGKIWFQKIQN